MCEVVAIASQKGGVGKTTTAVNLGASLATLGFKTLLIDLDPQGSATVGFGFEEIDVSLGLAEFANAKTDPFDCIHPSGLPNLKFIPANISSLNRYQNRETEHLSDSALSEQFIALRDVFDYILVDCPPSFSQWTCNALACADSVIVPIQCEYYALKSLGGFLRAMRELKRERNITASYKGFLLTMVDMRNNIAKRVCHRVRYTLRDLVFETAIPRNVRLAEAPMYGRPALQFDQASAGAQSYLKLAYEVLEQDHHLHSKQLGTTSSALQHG